MKTLTLSLFDALQLESELNGLKNPQTNEVIYKGFINHNLSVVLKYDLLDLSEDLKSEKTKVDELRNELVKKYGEVDSEGNYTIRMYDEVDGKQNTTKLADTFIEFENEYNQLLSQTKEFSYNEITRDDLKKAGDSTDNYRFLFKLVKKNEDSI